MTPEGFVEDTISLSEMKHFDFAQEMASLEQTKPWPMGRSARILFKKPDFRMLLMSMEKGAVIKEHHADGTISVQVLKGSIRFTAQETTYQLGANQMVALAASIPHQVEAMEESAFLLTISWPDAVKL